MSEYTHPFRDSSFNLEQAYNYTLLMLIDSDTFIYAITYKDMLLAYDYDCSVVELQEPREFSLKMGWKFLHKMEPELFGQTPFGAVPRNPLLLVVGVHGADRVRGLDLAASDRGKDIVDGMTCEARQSGEQLVVGIVAPCPFAPTLDHAPAAGRTGVLSARSTSIAARAGWPEKSSACGDA